MFPGAIMINSLFWMIFGALQIFIIASLCAWVKHMGKPVKYWQIGILYSMFALFCITVGGGFTLAGEFESQAGWYFIGFLGVPLVISFVVALKLFYFRKLQ